MFTCMNDFVRKRNFIIQIITTGVYVTSHSLYFSLNFFFDNPFSLILVKNTKLKFIQRNNMANLLYKIIERNNAGTSAKEVDKSIKNKWVWDWLTEKDVNGDFLSDYIKKIDQPGVALCSWCNDTIVYGSSGKKRLHLHSKLNKEKHLNKK